MELNPALLKKIKDKKNTGAVNCNNTKYFQIKILTLKCGFEVTCRSAAAL
jgi:hypothetical protein